MATVSYNSRILTPWKIADLLGAEVRLLPGPWPQFYRKGKPIGYIHKEGLFSDFKAMLCLAEGELVPQELQNPSYLF
jgi:hypothetical protein